MKELLSPAGNIECAYAAVRNGADAIYLGGKNFGARKYASNFTNEELKEVVDYCHLYNVKVYVTVNTIVYNEEIDSLIEYVRYLYNIGVDALIMQDIGMINLVRNKFPNLEINASTQMHNHNNEGIKLLKELGIKKVVLDRELSLEEINKLDANIEKEVFIHGALCNSYSGCCLFSSLNGGRSGNRGQCVQSCRLPYKLIKNNSYVKANNMYPLSTKELNTIENFDKILSSNISSFKIEGRMKSPAYVGYVTKLYRKLIDNKTNNITNEELDNLKILFNRQFTNGYLFNDKVMNTMSSNHQGLEIGKVLEITPKKIKIKLTKELYQEDGIRFKNSNLGMIANMIYNEKDLLINKGNINDIIYIDNKINLKEKDIVLKTSSNYLEKEILNIKDKKIKIKINVQEDNNKLKVEFIDNLNNIVKDFVPVEESINRSTTKEEIREKLSKLGNTPFEVQDINISISNNIFVSMKLLNELRRTLVDNLIKERIKIKRDNIELDIKKEINNNNITKDYEISVLARTRKQVEASLSMNVDRIYVDTELFNEYKNNNKIYLRTNRVEHNFNYDSNNILAAELGAINKYKNKNLISDYYLNIVNNYSINYLLNNNVKRITLSPEINYDNLDKFNNKDKLELIVYGKLELMLTKSCPIKELGGCPCNKEDIYYLEDTNKNKYRILHNNCLTHIMHYKNIDYIDKIEYYKSLGIKSYRLELLDESYDEVVELINKISKYLK